MSTIYAFYRLVNQIYDFAGFWSGTNNLNVEPWFKTDSKVIVDFRIFDSFIAIYKPSPVPVDLLVL